MVIILLFLCYVWVAVVVDRTDDVTHSKFVCHSSFMLFYFRIYTVVGNTAAIAIFSNQLDRTYVSFKVEKYCWGMVCSSRCSWQFFVVVVVRLHSRTEINVCITLLSFTNRPKRKKGRDTVIDGIHQISHMSHTAVFQLVSKKHCCNEHCDGWSLSHSLSLSLSVCRVLTLSRSLPALQ